MAVHRRSPASSPRSSRPETRWCDRSCSAARPGRQPRVTDLTAQPPDACRPDATTRLRDRARWTLRLAVGACVLHAAALSAPLATLSAAKDPAPAKDTPPASAPSTARLVILAGSQPGFRQAADRLRAALKDVVTDVRVMDHPPENDAGARKAAAHAIQEARPTLIAAAGAAAGGFALEHTTSVPVLIFMAPNALDTPQLDDTSSQRARVACVAADVPPDRQLEWMLRVQPGIRRIGVLFSKRTARTVAALERAAAARRVEIGRIEADKDQFPRAIEALQAGNCDGVLMLPDAAVYNAPNVEHLLLWGVRNHKPVWAFSANVVKAGAFAGQFVEADAVVGETVEAIRKLMSGAPPSAVGVVFPSRISRAVNEHTSDMIGVPIPAGSIGPDTQRLGDQP